MISKEHGIGVTRGGCGEDESVPVECIGPFTVAQHKTIPRGSDMSCNTPYPPAPTTGSLTCYWSRPVHDLAQLTPPTFTGEEKERHRIYCYLLMALLADYWTPKKLSKTSSPGASPLYLGHNIAALAVNEGGEILGFDFNHNEIFNS